LNIQYWDRLIDVDVGQEIAFAGRLFDPDQGAGGAIMIHMICAAWRADAGGGNGEGHCRNRPDIERCTAGNRAARLPFMATTTPRSVSLGHRLPPGPASHQGREEARKGGEEKGYCLSGRRYGSLERNFKLPEGIDTDKIEARFVKGVL
jgi:hypothetical protein